MYNCYNFLLTVKSELKETEDSLPPADFNYQYTTITGTVIASDEDIAKELIEEYFVEGTDNIIDSCEVEFINAVMPGVQDYKFKGIVYSKN